MITKKFCPRCGSEDVHMIAGGTTGQWMCKNCNYIGSVLEKVITGSELKSKKDKTGESKKNG